MRMRIAATALWAILQVGVIASPTPVFEYRFPASYSGPTTPRAVVDQSPTGHDAIFDNAGAGTLEDDRPDGFDGALMSVSGSNGCHGATAAVDLLDTAAVDAAGGFMMEMWFQWEGTYTDSRKLIDYAGTEHLGTRGGNIEFTLSDGASRLAHPIVSGRWYHVIAVFDSSGHSAEPDPSNPGEQRILGDAYLYVDRELVDSATDVWKSGFGDSLDRPIGINRWAGGGADYFQGKMFHPSVHLGVDPPEPADPDFDEDGLPTPWEIIHGLDPHDDGSIDPDNGARGDPDGDGLPNDEEFQLGSSPVDAQDPDGRAWRARPEKTGLMIISCHPDDEGIFFGGVYPYYTQVRQVPTVGISMTSGDWQQVPEIRESEFRDAAWTYGLRNPPIFPRFKDYPTATLDQTWDVWADGVMDGDDIAEGRERAGRTLAYWMRRYRPDVVLTHDFGGEYGHNNHKATALATADAVLLAADPAEDIGDLPAWQVKKFYVHRYGTNPLFHDHFDEVSIDTDGDGIPDKTPVDVANDGLDLHVSQGSPNVSTVHASGEVSASWAPHPGEWWGLYSSTVGPDTIEPDFVAPDPDNNPTTYSGWARGDFFENLTVFPDSDYDGLPDAWELAHFPDLAAADPAADDDGDRRDNLDEFAAGLDPRVADRIDLSIAPAGTSLSFVVPEASGPGYEGLVRRYELRFSPDLDDWSTIVAEGVGDGTSTDFGIPPGSPRGFYRLVLTVE